MAEAEVKEPVAENKPSQVEYFDADDSPLEATPSPGVPQPVGETDSSSTPAASSPPERDPETGRFVKQAHSGALVKVALGLGFTQEEIDTATPSELALAAILRQQSSTPATATTPSEEVALPWGTEEDGTPIDEGKYDPGLLRVVKDQAKRLKALEAQLAAQSQNESKRQYETAIQTADRVFLEHEQVYGKGTSAPDSDEHLVRSATWDLAKKLKGTVEERLRKAHGILHGKKTATSPKQQVTTPLTDEWRAAGLAQPTQRAGANEPNGRAKAIKSVEEYLKETHAQTAATIADEFPD